MLIVLAVVLALASSLTWGVSDFLGGLESRSLPTFAVLLASQSVRRPRRGSGRQCGWALLLARITTVAIFVTAAATVRATVTLRRRDLPALALIGVLVLAADLLYAIATTQGLLGVVAVLGSLFPVVTIVMARLFLQEWLHRRQQVGILLCIIGAIGVSTR